MYDFREREFIDYREPNGSYVGTGGMRLELRKDKEGTVFTFLDTWAVGVESVGEREVAEQPGGLGTPWPGVVAGWHDMINRLASIATGVSARHYIGALSNFYVGYLSDLYPWQRSVQRLV